MGALVDSLRMIWYRRVINFDQTDQQELAAKATEYGKTHRHFAKAMARRLLGDGPRVGSAGR